MQKEKQVRSYKRRTKSGKIITVKAHTAKYEAADEKAKKSSKKEGAGKELEELKKKSTQLESTTSEPAFTAAEFKEWYRGTGSAADKKVAKALRAQLGRSGYRKLEDEAIDNYTTRGHLSMFKRVGSGGQSSSDSKKSATRVASKSMDSKKVANKDNWRKTSDTPLRKKGDMAVGSMNVGKRSIDLEVRPTDKGYEVSMYDRKGNIGHLGNIHIKTLSDLSKQVKSEVAPKRKLTSKLMDSGEIDYGTVRVKSKKLKSQEV